MAAAHFAISAFCWFATDARSRARNLVQLAGAGSDGADLPGSFAGSGALGFEAASRGASKVVMVENAPRTLEALEANARLLAAVAGQLEIVYKDAVRFTSSLRNTGSRFDVLFLDPPFEQGWIDRLTPLLPEILTEDGVLYVEAEHVVHACGDWRTVRSGRAGQVFIT